MDFIVRQNVTPLDHSWPRKTLATSRVILCEYNTAGHFEIHLLMSNPPINNVRVLSPVGIVATIKYS